MAISRCYIKLVGKKPTLLDYGPNTTIRDVKMYILEKTFGSAAENMLERYKLLLTGEMVGGDSGDDVPLATAVQKILKKGQTLGGTTTLQLVKKAELIDDDPGKKKR